MRNFVLAVAVAVSPSLASAQSVTPILITPGLETLLLAGIGTVAVGTILESVTSNDPIANAVNQTVGQMITDGGTSGTTDTGSATSGTN